jgi:U3 small nucleolar RNA-associated protein 22
MTTSSKRRRTSVEIPEPGKHTLKVTTHDAPASREEPVTKQLKKVHNTSTEETLQALGDVYQYKSNIFKMEMKEMLAEVGVDYKKRMAPVERTLHLLKGVIDNIPERAEVTVCEFALHARKELTQ